MSRNEFDAAWRNAASRDVPSAFDDATTRILLHVMQGRATVRSCAEACGMSPSATYARMIKLYEAGLIEWEPDRKGTLRPMVRPVPFGLR